MAKNQSWTISDEFLTIDYIGSDEMRGNRIVPTLFERKQKLKAYIRTVYNRKPIPGVSMKMCEMYAQTLLATLSSKGE